MPTPLAPEYVGKTAQIRADDTTVRILLEGREIASHPRCWERRRYIENPEHLAKLLERRPGAHLSRSRDRIAALCSEAPLYPREVARTRHRLKTEIDRLTKLLLTYGRTELAGGIAEALSRRLFGANFVRALMDQARFARGQPEPPEPVLTGNALADNVDVEAHPMESYDELFNKPPAPGDD